MPDDAASLAARAAAAEARLDALEAAAGGGDAAATRVKELEATVERLEYRVRLLKAAVAEADDDLKAALSGDAAAVAALKEKVAARGG